LFTLFGELPLAAKALQGWVGESQSPLGRTFCPGTDKLQKRSRITKVHGRSHVAQFL